MKKAISARIDEDTLTYIKGCHEHVNTLINILLNKWVKDRQNKELLLWNVDTGQDEFSQMKARDNFKCSQSCNNCIYTGYSNNLIYQCNKEGYINTYPKHFKSKFVCCNWEYKKKGSN